MVVLVRGFCTCEFKISKGCSGYYVQCTTNPQNYHFSSFVNPWSHAFGWPPPLYIDLSLCFCLKLYFFILLSKLYTKTFSFYCNNDNVWNKHFGNWKSSVYFENKLEQLGAFNEACMNECVSMSISIQATSRLSPQYGLWSMARMKSMRKWISSLSRKPEMAA